MRTIHRYIVSSFLITFLVTLVVFTFVMCIGILFKATDLIARGVAWQPILKVVLSGIPGALAFSLPLSALTGSLLVFGRLSSDGEITAMRACGIGIWQIMSGPLIVAVLLAAICLGINSEISPRTHFARRSMKASVGAVSPLEMLEEGRFIQDFSGLTVYIGQKSGSKLNRVRIYDLRSEGIKREILAQSGVINVNTNSQDLVIDLFDVRVNPFYDDRPGAAFCSKWSVVIKDALKISKYRKREKDMTLQELRLGMVGIEQDYPDLSAQDRMVQKMKMSVEFNKRLTLSLACFAFVFLGIPLGIKAHRKESSIGVALSLLFVFNFYLFIIIAEALVKRPEWHPDFIVWMPVALSLLIGWILARRGA